MAGYTYTLTNKTNKVLYTGSTNCIERRLSEHKLGINRKSFSYKYNVNKLVLLERYPSYREAFKREQQIKDLNHDEKVELIKKHNPKWQDLSNGIDLSKKRHRYK